MRGKETASLRLVLADGDLSMCSESARAASCASCGGLASERRDPLEGGVFDHSPGGGLVSRAYVKAIDGQLGQS